MSPLTTSGELKNATYCFQCLPQIFVLSRVWVNECLSCKKVSNEADSNIYYMRWIQEANNRMALVYLEGATTN